MSLLTPSTIQEKIARTVGTADIPLPSAGSEADTVRRFAELAPQQVLTSACFDTLYHEIFNELDAGPVFAALQRWLDQRF